MASRKEQKEQARAARLAEEKARAEREARQRRVQMIGGGVIALVALAAVAVVLATGGGGATAGTGKTTAAANTSGVKLPAQKITDLSAAVKAAGCVAIDTPDSIARTDANRQHVNAGTKVAYKTNPPSYGPHYAAPASDGEYKPSETPATGFLLHALEHGRIEYQYSPSLPAADVTQLEALFNETDGQWAPHQMLLLYENPTKMPYAVAASAWGHVIGCKTFTPQVFDAFRAFRMKYTDQGPEQLGTGPE